MRRSCVRVDSSLERAPRRGRVSRLEKRADRAVGAAREVEAGGLQHAGEAEHRVGPVRRRRCGLGFPGCRPSESSPTGCRLHEAFDPFACLPVVLCRPCRTGKGWPFLVDLHLDRRAARHRRHAGRDEDGPATRRSELPRRRLHLQVHQGVMYASPRPDARGVASTREGQQNRRAKQDRAFSVADGETYLELSSIRPRAIAT